MPKFKNNTQPITPNAAQQMVPQREIELRHVGIPGLPVGAPPGIPGVQIVNTKKIGKSEPPPLALPGSNLERAINYYADYAGCGFWRMIWPELLLNGFQKGIINGLTTMVLDPRFYNGIKAVRLQRQATPMQLEFVKFLKHFQQHHQYKLIYEIDDIIFKEDIPDFNRCKVAFEDETIFQSSLEMMKLSDEISVTCQYMKDYYIDKTGNKNITVIPNYPPRFWADGFYDKKEISNRYNKHKKRPRIGYCGSGTHIDVINKTGQKDDFEHIVQHIIKTRKDFKWVMMGAFPLPIKPFIDNGDIEFAGWAEIFNYPRAIHDLELTASIAPLQDCHFNRAKSNIKYLEAACQGIPGVYQDIVTYEMAPLRFNNGDELIDQLNTLIKDESTYMKYSTKARQYAEGMWLEDHLDEYAELYYKPFGSPEREALLKRNPTN